MTVNVSTSPDAIRAILGLVKPGLGRMEASLARLAETDDAILAPMLSTVLPGTGKRLRPALALLIGRLAPTDPEALNQMAVGVQAILSSGAARTLVMFSVLASFVYGTDTVLLVGVSDAQLGTGAKGFGYLLAGLGVGGILMALVVDRLASSRRLAWIITGGLAVYCLPTALLVAVEARALDAVRALLELGADPRRHDAGGANCLERAVRSGNVEMLGALVERAAPSHAPSASWRRWRTQSKGRNRPRRRLSAKASSHRPLTVRTRAQDAPPDERFYRDIAAPSGAQCHPSPPAPGLCSRRV